MLVFKMFRCIVLNVEPTPSPQMCEAMGFCSLDNVDQSFHQQSLMLWGETVLATLWYFFFIYIFFYEEHVNTLVIRLYVSFDL